MSSLLTSSQKAATALQRAEKALRNWQDDPDSPRGDVDKMLAIIAELRGWVQGHVLADVERARHTRHAAPPITEQSGAIVSELHDEYNHVRRDDEE